MRLLNLGCGSNRPGPPWTNVDCLLGQFPAESPEAVQLRSEDNYIDWDISQPLPFTDKEFDGILASHVIEHFTCHEAIVLLKECRRVLKPDGCLVVSVPDAEYFLSVYDQDTPERAVELFGEPIHDKWQPNFFSYALLHREHRQVLDCTTLTCLLYGGGFKTLYRLFYRFKRYQPVYTVDAPALAAITEHLNRPMFSLVMAAIKDAE